MNLGVPLKPMRPLLRSCVEVREPIELSFDVVSRVGPGIDALDGVHMPQGEGLFVGFFGIYAPMVWMGRMAYCLPRNVFDSCVKSWQDIVRDVVLLAFWWYSQIQDRNGG